MTILNELRFPEPDEDVHHSFKPLPLRIPLEIDGFIQYLDLQYIYWIDKVYS
jgi:hypothetical protein